MGLLPPREARNALKTIGRILRSGVVRTKRGFCALAWSEKGLAALRLPEPDAARALRGLKRQLPSGTIFEKALVPRALVLAVERAVSGRPFKRRRYDLSSLTHFQRLVLQACARIPPGRVLSYGGLARKAGRPRACRAVGQVMRRNPIPLLIPCHRVVAAGMRIGGFTGGVATKAKMLKNEGIIIRKK